MPKNKNNIWQGLGLRPGDILLPKAEHKTTYWSVVALDQYTSQPEIWQAADQEIGEHPSTLRLIVPEAFLDEAAQRSQQVFLAMEDYQKRDLFDTFKDSLILLERETQSGKRVGLVVLLDLEDYDYAPGSSSLIRATEETVLDRIPPRLIVREQSKLEVSHVMLLVDDPKDSLLGPLYQKRETLTPVYDLPLLMQGGHLKGWQVKEEGDLLALSAAIKAQKDSKKPGELLFAVGDGNHSLATAKASWEKQKAKLRVDEQENHPARFALAELVNLHSEALVFEPIHRLVFHANRQLIQEILAPLQPVAAEQKPDLILLDGEGRWPLAFHKAGDGLIIAAVQQLLDESGLEMDYVHGEDALKDIQKREGGVGLLMPDFEKSRLFPTVQEKGRLPRKTFSMGEANEKRFYMEARRITKD